MALKATHFDFTDFTYVWPLFRTIGYMGSIDAMRMIDIMNTVVLSFFDHSPKGRPVPGELLIFIDPNAITDSEERLIRVYAGRTGSRS